MWGTAVRPFDERIVDLGGVLLFVRRYGDPGAPVLLGIHGGPGWDHSYLPPAMGDLADIRQVVLFDLRRAVAAARCIILAYPVSRSSAVSENRQVTAHGSGFRHLQP
jgi:pimeloyl-ACP methyl ester carboxylesterase